MRTSAQEEGETGLSNGLRHRPLHDRFVQMIPVGWTPSWIAAHPRCGKHELPTPLDRRGRILPDDGLRQDNATESACEVTRVDPANALEVASQGCVQSRRQGGHPIFASLPATHHDLAGRKVQVLDA